MLHTWDQKLRFHPHLHVVVPNAGFDVDSGEWKTGSGAWLAPVKVLASFFRRRFLKELARAHGRGGLEFHGAVAHLANPGEFHATLAAARGRNVVKRAWLTPCTVARSTSYRADRRRTRAPINSRANGFDRLAHNPEHRQASFWYGGAANPDIS